MFSVANIEIAKFVPNLKMYAFYTFFSLYFCFKYFYKLL